MGAVPPACPAGVNLHARVTVTVTIWRRASGAAGLSPMPGLRDHLGRDTGGNVTSLVPAWKSGCHGPDGVPASGSAYAPSQRRRSDLLQ